MRERDCINLINPCIIKYEDNHFQLIYPIIFKNASKITISLKFLIKIHPLI